MTVATQNQQGQKLAGDIAMIVVLLSVAMLFATLFLGYFIYRATSDVWPPMGMERVSLLFPIASTVLVALSSSTLSRVQQVVKERNIIDRGALTLTLALGTGFLVSQMMLWGELNATGLTAQAGIFPSILHAFTWVHAGHMVVGWLFLVSLFFYKGEMSYKQSNRALNVAKFWHFLGPIWLIMFISMFVV